MSPKWREKSAPLAWMPSNVAAASGEQPMSPPAANTNDPSPGAGPAGAPLGGGASVHVALGAAAPAWLVATGPVRPVATSPATASSRYRRFTPHLRTVAGRGRP